ncbi:hypothetical protein N5P37_011729 [Trichoderma harzianum]|nr:hypothetical protein N5P37_011729 [Trichoderma harzianum]PKK41131.1 hypothetical protein CI102_15189 [Trichoderma harzianum]
MSVFNLAKPDRPIEVGVILMNGETEILDVAPVDMLHCFSKKFIETLPEEWVSEDVKAQALDLNFHWVSEVGSAKQSRLTSAISLVPTHSFETCPPLDVVLIGAHNVGYTPNDAELAFVRKAWNDCSAFLTICAGVEVAVQAGILGGKTATAPRFMINTLRRQSQSINWVEKRWARDGKLWTSGAFLNGTDLLYAFAHTVWGGEGTPVSRMSAIGGWPIRDVNYKNDADGL